MVMKYSDLYLEARRALIPTRGQQEAGFLARQLLCAASGKSQEDLLADRDRFADDLTIQTLRSYVERTLKEEPLAYILGQWEFFGMTLEITPDVLIPRDDTMAVAELAVKKALFLEQNPRILDLCTGSGCIGLAIASKVKDARVTLADVSKEALAVAKRNIALHRLTGRVSCMQVDALAPAPAFLGQFDLIVSNPPYVTDEEMSHLQPSVAEYEPHLALRGGADGLEFYRAIVKNFAPALQPDGFLCFEFGAGQAPGVCQILQQGGFRVLEVKKDYGNIDRAVLAQKE